MIQEGKHYQHLGTIPYLELRMLDLLIPTIFHYFKKNQAIILATLKTFIYLCNVISC